MDRSYLSDAGVVAASRNFVCLRLVTYEDQAEADFMKSLFVGRSGQLENTTFAILTPDGKQKLTAAGRGPFFAYRNAAHMAAGMNYLSAQYAGSKEAALTDEQLPVMKSLRLALNVAAADGLPLIAIVANDKQRLDELSRQAVQFAWNSQLAGQFIYASVTDRRELEPIKDVEVREGIIVVQPGQFGLTGTVSLQARADEIGQDTPAKLRNVVATFPRKWKDHHAHVRAGIRLGVDWESEIPETDPMSLRARLFTRGRQ